MDVTTTMCGDDLLKIGNDREAQTIGSMHHGASSRLMAPQSIRSADLQEPYSTPSPGNWMTEASLLKLYSDLGGEGW